jgi:hypothetical protein
LDSSNNIYVADSGNDRIQKFSQTEFCDTVSDIPPAECSALKDIYENTGGSNWTNKTGWGTSASACSWHGVTCTSGHVTSISLGNNNLTGT